MEKPLKASVDKFSAKIAFLVVGAAVLNFLVSSPAVAGENVGIWDLDVPGFSSDLPKLLSEFDSFAVPPKNRLHLLVDGGFDIIKKGEFAKSKIKSELFVSKVMKTSKVALSESDKNDVVEFMSEMPPVQGLSSSMEIRPKTEDRVETLCRIGINIDKKDTLLITGMFDDKKNIELMRERAKVLDISAKDVHEYFMVHELAHCVTGMSSFGLNTPPKLKTSSEEQVATLKREMFADALAALFWIRQGHPRKMFSFVIEGRALEFDEFKALDHMTIPVVIAAFDEFDTPLGRRALLSMSPRDVLETAAVLSTRAMPSRKDVFKTVDRAYPGYYEAAKKEGTLGDRWSDIRAGVKGVPDNKTFVDTVLSVRPQRESSQIVRGATVSLGVFSSSGHMSKNAKQN